MSRTDLKLWLRLKPKKIGFCLFFSKILSESARNPIVLPEPYLVLITVIRIKSLVCAENFYKKSLGIPVGIINNGTYRYSKTCLYERFFLMFLAIGELNKLKSWSEPVFFRQLRLQQNSNRLRTTVCKLYRYRYILKKIWIRVNAMMRPVSDPN